MIGKVENKKWYNYKTFYPLVACGQSMMDAVEKEDSEVFRLLDVVKKKAFFPYIYSDEDVDSLNDYLDFKCYGVKYYECNGFDDTVWLFPLPSSKEYNNKRDLFIKEVEEQLEVVIDNCLNWIVYGIKPSGC